MAALLPLAGYSPTWRRRWRRAFYVLPVCGLALESIQAFRGLDPRITEQGGPAELSVQASEVRCEPESMVTVEERERPALELSAIIHSDDTSEVGELP